MSTRRLISAVCWKLPGLCPGSMTTTLPLSGPEAAGAEALGVVAVGAGSAFPSSVGEPGTAVEGAAESGRETEAEDEAAPARPEPPESPGPPTASYTSQPSNAPGTSAASATVSGPRRDRRGCGGSKSGPTYDTSATLTGSQDPRFRSPQHAQRPGHRHFRELARLQGPEVDAVRGLTGELVRRVGEHVVDDEQAAFGHMGGPALVVGARVLVCVAAVDEDQAQRGVPERGDLRGAADQRHHVLLKARPV